jgi:hypothetical protein
MDELQRYFDVATRMNSGDASKADIEFFFSYSPKVDKTFLEKAVKDGKVPSIQDATKLLMNAGNAAMSTPAYKEHMLEIQKDAEKGKLTDSVAQGIDLVLKGSDIAQSIAQIHAANRGLRSSRRPVRPAIPQREAALQAALRDSQQGNEQAARAMAPVQAQIQDQYNSDIANARTASTGQAGAFGAGAQLASDRRNRAALNLAPIQDQFAQQQRDRQDRLVGQRMDETQRMYDNNAALYPYDLHQYNLEQEQIGALGSQGRSNLRNSLYNAAGSVAPAVANAVTNRKYADLRNRAQMMYGPDAADTMVSANKKMEDYWAQTGSGSYEDVWNAYSNR